jgi:hypothetical protein
LRQSFYFTMPLQLGLAHNQNNVFAKVFSPKWSLNIFSIIYYVMMKKMTIVISNDNTT